MKTTHSILVILIALVTWLFASTGIAYAQSPDSKAHKVELLDGRHMKYETVMGAAVAASQRGVVVVSFADDPTSITYHARMQEFVDNPTKWLLDWDQEGVPAIGALIQASPDERVELSLNGEAWIFVGGRPYDRTNELARFTTSLQASVEKVPAVIPEVKTPVVQEIDARHMKYEDVVGGALTSSNNGIVVVSFADDATSDTYLARMQEFVDNPTKWLLGWERDEPPAITGLILASPDERVEESLNGEAWIFVRGRPYDRANELPRFTTSLQDSVLKLYETDD